MNALKPELNKIFKPAFLGRMVIVPYYPGPRRSAEEDHRAEAWQDSAPHSRESQDRLTYDDALIEEVARRCTEVESGARNVDNILTNTLLAGDLPPDPGPHGGRREADKRFTWASAQTARLSIAPIGTGEGPY